MKVSVEDKRIREKNIPKNDRKIVSTANSMGILRIQVAKHIGVERMDSFLFQFGWEMGKADGLELMKTGQPLAQLVVDGPIKHIKSGHINGVDHRCDIEYNADGSLKTLIGRGEWFGSYEVEQHMEYFGLSEEPVCHTLAGYSSGFMSTIFNKPLIAKEITCVGAGHDSCQWMVRPEEVWGEDVKQSVKDLLDRKPILEELEYTYDNLLEQTEFITRLSSFQKGLTSEVVNGRGLQDIADKAGKTLKSPVTIENLSMETIASSGLTEEEREDLYEATVKLVPNFLVKEQNRYTLSSRKEIFELEHYNRVVVPVLVQKQLLGYCSMITGKKESGDYEAEYLYLEHLASAAALVLLNEKAAFESLGRMKGSYLEQVLNEEIPKAELLKRGKFIDIDFSQPYRLVAVDYDNEKETLEEEFNFQEQLLDLTYQYYRNRGQQVLTGYKDDKLIIMLFDPERMNEIMDDYTSYIGQYLKHMNFHMGISGVRQDIENAVKGYEEARIALRLAIRKDRLYYDELGVVGVLINSNNVESIQMLAQDQLKSLYDIENHKSHELFETLYCFLGNGGNLKNTANDLSLSMSGLRHRIQRIEDLLEKDLRDQEVSNNLLLIMKALIVLKDIKL